MVRIYFIIIISDSMGSSSSNIVLEIEEGSETYDIDFEVKLEKSVKDFKDAISSELKVPQLN